MCDSYSNECFYFCRTQRRPPGGGRLRLLSEEQERELVNMVIANNVIRLQEIQRRVIEDDHLFRGINAISLSTIDRILRKNQFRMKQAYRVPFERNSDRVKNQRVEYVQVWVLILYKVLCTITAWQFMLPFQHSWTVVQGTDWLYCVMCFAENLWDWRTACSPWNNLCGWGRF